MTRPQFFGLHAEPSRRMNLFLMVIPFVVLIGLYFVASYYRHLTNESDKLLPSISQMADAFIRMAFVQDRRTGDYLLLTDALHSLYRIFTGVFLASITALLIGLNMGLYKGFKALSNPLVTFIAMVPPLSILPILFIVFGVGDFGKIMLIFIGTAPIMVRDVSLYVSSIPKETVIKAQTLGAKDLAVTYRIIMPMVIPKLIDSIRLSLGSAWLFVIAAEGISSTNGLGYRIFLMRRYMNMEVIIPYVILITLLGVGMDLALRHYVKKRYNWYVATNN
ncbi:ABC transporter permease [Vibrio cholerae]|uniref:ABC transporter permease n=1 Tax=Vibrio cholerae TaxID=666 RepID=UPI000BA8EFD6|nr:ABC transporter permease [Vibrio cholerae]MCD6725147.1 ABC transporter permease [Vibrio cholerae]PAS38671.1 lipid kinase [Vibrio cholerae]TQQ05357.1 ABC transporter permease [Vibrio cholerae]TQQ11994.1 ABC transporter permease [Vibrio cholerae]TQQ40441.1 ABC transporter permease [Vibrio cholerae]